MTDRPLLGGPPGTGPSRVPGPLRHSLRAMRHREFRLFWWGALVSNIGQWLQNLTVPFVLYGLTDSATWVGLATFSQFMPAMLLGPLGGSLADRLERRKVLIVGQTAAAVLALALWAVWVAGLRSPTLILVVTAAGGVVNGLNIPSWQAFVPSLVPRDHLSSAITLNSLQFNAARAVGPAVAGVLLAALGPSWAFLLNAVTFGFVIAALSVIRVASRPEGGRPSGSVHRQFLDAVAYVRGQPGIWVGIVVAALVGFLGNPILQLTVVFAEDVFAVGPLGFGLLSASLGLGALLAAPLVAGLSDRVSRARVVGVALPGYAVAVACFGAAPVFSLGVLALVGAGAGFLAVISVTNTAVQDIVADRVRGRVMATRVMTFTAAYPLGGLLQGWLADVWGPRPTVVTAGLVLLVASLVLRSRGELLARLDDPPDPR